MSDNITLNPGLGGDKLRADDVGGGVKIPIHKVGLGLAHLDGGMVSEHNPFPVQGNVQSIEARRSMARLSTAKIWGPPGATSPTVQYALNLDALAVNAGRMGQGVYLGEEFDQEWLAFLWVETGTAPTGSAAHELYLAYSHNGTDWPGKVTGTDAAYPTNVDQNKLQLSAFPIATGTGTQGAVVLCKTLALANTLLLQQPVIFRPLLPWVCPVVVNKTSQAIRNQTPDSNNKSRVILMPRILYTAGPTVARWTPSFAKALIHFDGTFTPP